MSKNPIILHWNKKPRVVWPNKFQMIEVTNYTEVLVGKACRCFDETPAEILKLIEAAAVTKCGECVYWWNELCWRRSMGETQANNGCYRETFCGEGQIKAEILIERMAGK